MKVGLLPANMHKRVNTRAARPKMTGINAVGRSIFAEKAMTVLERETTNVVRIQRERWDRNRNKGRRRVGIARNRKQSSHVCETTKQTTQLQLSLAWL
jgi:hypothetical protein